MEYSVYVLRGRSKRYVGLTSKDPKTRLVEHNQKSNKYSKNNGPYKLVYFEKGYCKQCALKREKFLKSGQGRRLLDIIEEIMS